MFFSCKYAAIKTVGKKKKSFWENIFLDVAFLLHQISFPWHILPNAENSRSPTKRPKALLCLITANPLGL